MMASKQKNSKNLLEACTIEEPGPSAPKRAVDEVLWKREGTSLRCLICTRACLLHDKSTGYCTAITNDAGTLYSTAYGVIAEVSVTPIEKRPVYHYRPGTRTLCLGGLGCNLRCAFCQNWEVAFRDARHGGHLPEPNIPPERAVSQALQEGCQGIAWTFNEPSISPIYLRDCGRLAHEAGLYTVLVTNGLLTHKALDFLGPFIDVYRVDVKSLDASFYRTVAGTARTSEMFAVARRAQWEYGMHIEIVTNIMPSLNDSSTHLRRLADTITHELGVNTPWHLTSYVPYAYMTHIPPTSPARLAQARAIGREAGLCFVYTDDVTVPTAAHTFCPACGACVIERAAGSVCLRAVSNEGTCTNCGSVLGMQMTAPRSS